MTMEVFRRQTLKQRGHFSNYFTLRPIKELGFAEEYLRVFVGKRRIEIPYNQLGARIIERHRYKPYGAGIGGNVKQTLIKITSKDRAFRFDLSAQFPDFKDRKKILALIKSNISTSTSSEDKKAFKRKQNMQFYIAVCVLFIVLGVTVLMKGDS